MRKFFSLSPIFIVAIIFSLPAIFIFLSLAQDFSSNWIHLVNTVLPEYLLNSLKLFIGVSVGVFILGVSTAWIISTCEFRGKKFFSWALILPFAIPPYIMSYAFTGLFDSYGSANDLVRFIFQLDPETVPFPSVRNITGAIIIFSFTLYPYVFLISQTSFLNQSRDIFDVSRTLGLSRFKTFFKVALPIARPSIVAALMLVGMEVLSDFGAVEHFAIPTFTSGIFRTWFGLNDLTTAKQLASILFMIFLFLILIEKYSRRKILYTSNSTSNRELVPTPLKGYKEFFAIIICSLPIFVGFIIPFVQLLYWTIFFDTSFFTSDFLSLIKNSLSLAVISSILCLFIATIINYIIRIEKNNFLSFINKVITSGYGIPGIVLALGVLNLFLMLDNISNIILTGSLVGLIFAYCIKFYAVTNSSISSGFKKISINLDNVASSLGSSKRRILKSIHLPLLKSSFIIGMLVFMIEVIKELPATLILRPFNFNTLSVSAYNYASDERMIEAAAPSIGIVIACLIPIIILIKLIGKEEIE